MESMVMELLRLAEQGAAQGSLNQEHSQWNYWLRYCASLTPPTCPWRTDMIANSGNSPLSYREMIVQAGFLPWLAINMPPKLLSDQEKDIPSKPGSWLGALLVARGPRG